MAARSLATNELAWACQILAAAQFFLTGVDKLSGAPAMVGLFDTVGFGQWFRVFTGTVEVTGAVLLLMPSLAAVGAALLGLVMIGALIAHATVVAAPPIRPITLFVMVGLVFWVRLPRGLRASAS